jgi:hypothetical protein
MNKRKTEKFAKVRKPRTKRTGDFNEAAKIFAEKFQMSPDSLRAYARLWQLETWLREMVYVELKSAHGPTWSNSIAAFENAKSKDKRLIHMATPQESPLAYKSLGELNDIIKDSRNWPLFATYYPPKHLLEAKLTELFQVRHRVAHFRRPHGDDLGRVEQFLRDIDQSFWRFTTSYNQNHPIVPVNSDIVAERFIEDDQYPWTEVSPNKWARLGRKDAHARFWLTIERTIRPWVDKRSLSDPIAPAAGVLYDVEFQALDHATIDYDKVLSRTKHLHQRCVHIILDAQFTVLRLTLPSITRTEDIIDTISEFREQVLRGMTGLPRQHDDRVEKLAAKWPEYILPPSNPLAFLCPDMPCSFFGA